jgi:DNA-3-methyladenine glycosylase
MMKSRFAKLPRSFYLRPTLHIAKELLGAFLMRKLKNEILIGKIVEVEAYLGENDPASHAYRGRTQRNDVMFWNGGHLYVYFTYGMHFCCNVVTGREGISGAVLLRAVEPIAGLETMARNRGIALNSEKDMWNLCSGPAKLCEAFAIGRNENGTDLCGNNIWLAERRGADERYRILRTSRVGVTNGTEHKWRFCIKDNRFVSPGRPALG